MAQIQALNKDNCLYAIKFQYFEWTNQLKWLNIKSVCLQFLCVKKTMWQIVQSIQFNFHLISINFFCSLWSSHDILCIALLFVRVARNLHVHKLHVKVLVHLWLRDVYLNVVHHFFIILNWKISVPLSMWMLASKSSWFG